VLIATRQWRSAPPRSWPRSNLPEATPKLPWNLLVAESAREIQRSATLTCPECGHCKTERMPVDACQFFYACAGCGARLKPKPGDCCVYCSYADVPCPPIQAGASCT
jgi:hypothetical protein